jgi:class 3 adenylate cyclase
LDGRGVVTAQRRWCGSCGTELNERAKFCGECGAAVSAVPHPAEYKQVTVLFADVVHSMDIAAAVGAERLREIMAGLADSCAVVIERYGGTVAAFTGDGVMAVFGAPVALEHHAARACWAALSIQDETASFAAELAHGDGIELALRVGLNSGQVIAGDLGSRGLGYTTIGEQVGMAQRMESVAASGGVMLSESTARLVEGAATLGEPQAVRIKGAIEPVTAYRLLGMGTGRRAPNNAGSELVGRHSEMSAVKGFLEHALGGHGVVVQVVGEPGIGKSRLVREVNAMAAVQGVDVFSASCESHTTQVPFHAVACLMRSIAQVDGLDGDQARARVRARFPAAEPDDALLLDDLLGIADPGIAIPDIDPDARRRRVTALVKAAGSSWESPAVYVIEDAHWIDELSESLLADFLTVIPQTPSLVLITYRPEYDGALARIAGARTIQLAPLDDSSGTALVANLLGRHPSVAALGRLVAERAAGNPFFAEELVRELAERRVLHGEPGAYTSAAEVREVIVPATVEATIAARIDRLDPKAKRTVRAAAVIGSRFGLEVLTLLEAEPVVDDLLAAKLIDQVSAIEPPEYVFHHPLIHSVAYQAQLRSDRSTLHRRVAAAIERGEPRADDENAALIAQHLSAGGDLDAAYVWHMRAATWATNRDISAARLSWERAAEIAGALPADHPQRVAMRIAPLTMLCGTGWRVHADVADDLVAELRQLCSAAEDNTSLGIATAGLVVGYSHQDRVPEASRLASEAWTLAEGVGDPTLTVGLSFPVIYGAIESGQWHDVLRWSQTVVELARGDPSYGNFLVGSPLALALTSRGMARYVLGRPGWRDDLRQGMDMGRGADPATYAGAVSYVYLLGIPFGVLTPDDVALQRIESAIRVAERSSDDVVVHFAQGTLAVALMHRRSAADRDDGRRLGAEVRDMFVRQRHNLADRPILEVTLAREMARDGDGENAIAIMRAVGDHVFRDARPLLWSIPVTGVLVETLLGRGADCDLADAEAAIGRLSNASTGPRDAMTDIWLLRMHALLARAHGDEAAYRKYRDRHRHRAVSLGFAGHTTWAEGMA